MLWLSKMNKKYNATLFNTFEHEYRSHGENIKDTQPLLPWMRRNRKQIQKKNKENMDSNIIQIIRMTSQTFGNLQLQLEMRSTEIAKWLLLVTFCYRYVHSLHLSKVMHVCPKCLNLLILPPKSLPIIFQGLLDTLNKWILSHWGNSFFFLFSTVTESDQNWNFGQMVVGDHISWHDEPLQDKTQSTVYCKVQTKILERNIVQVSHKVNSLCLW